MKISCLNTTVLKANNDNRTEERNNNHSTIPNLPLSIKVKHAPKRLRNRSYQVKAVKTKDSKQRSQNRRVKQSKVS